MAIALVSPLSGQLQQQDEEIDKVEIESERAHQRLLGEYVTGVALDIDLLDPLRVPGGQAGTPATEMANCSALEARKIFTRLASTTPIRPINRKDPNCERSRRVV